jgi:hypothetical protein
MEDIQKLRRSFCKRSKYQKSSHYQEGYYINQKQINSNITKYFLNTEEWTVTKRSALANIPLDNMSLFTRKSIFYNSFVKRSSCPKIMRPKPSFYRRHA